MLSYNEPNNVYVAELTGLTNPIREPGSSDVYSIRPNHIRPVSKESRASCREVITSIRFKGS